jgi:hypothetical protein
MIAVEVLIGILIATIVLGGIIKLGMPIADAFAERLKLKFQELEPEEERQLKARIAFLEEELRGLKQQVTNIQDMTAFAMKLLESHEAEGPKIEQSMKEGPAPGKNKL